MSYSPIGSNRTLNGSLTGDQINGTSRKSTNPTGAGQKKSKPRRQSRSEDAPLIVHCHLCWDWVWQRPQQFISRLSQRHRVLFVETIGPDSQLSSPVARFWPAPNHANVTILRLQFPSWRWTDGAYVDKTRRALVREFLQGPGAGKFENPIQWFYDPMATTAFLGQMDEILTVYDCMDELAQFRGAPPGIRDREALLLKEADVVFTGGYRLYESKRRANSNCHFYGCGVDLSHFGKAADPATNIPADIAQLRKPVLGYFGVIDERMDYGLLASLAESMPNVSVVMIGPVLKVDPSSLPQRPNLHWMGQRPYADLPACCKGFDVCLMPFALNESTEYINPTKALEYMATGRPIVSSAVPDVVRNFGSVVKVAANRDQFIAACRQACDRPDATAVKRGLDMAAAHSWESIVAQLENHVEEALSKKRRTEVIA